MTQFSAFSQYLMISVFPFFLMNCSNSKDESILDQKLQTEVSLIKTSENDLNSLKPKIDEFFTAHYNDPAKMALYKEYGSNEYLIGEIINVYKKNPHYYQDRFKVFDTVHVFSELDGKILNENASLVNAFLKKAERLDFAGPVLIQKIEKTRKKMSHNI